MPHQTNVEFVADLMQFGRRGALIQCFVITALQRYAENALVVRLADDSPINADAWQDCAREVLEKLEAHFK